MAIRTDDDDNLSATVWWRRRSTTETLLVLGVIAVGWIVLAFELGEGQGDATIVSYLLIVVAAVALPGRHRWPLVVLIVSALARIAVSWESGGDAAQSIAVAIALFAVASTGDRRRNLSAAIAIAVVSAVVVSLLSTDTFIPEFIGELALLLLPIAIGDAVRSRSERLRARIESEAEVRVQAERLRIARDLHDVVAHGLSTIAVQSGVAAHLIDRDPNQAREALEIINQTGRVSLEELRSMVGVLRSTDDAPLRPTPSDPNDLAAVLDGAVAAGVEVTADIDGSFPSDVSDGCVVAVHRIVQEALTNVVRHADSAPTALTIRHGVDQVVVTITNAPGGSAPGATASTGVGLVGMRERADSLGGTLRTGSTPDGGFEVEAVIPYHGRNNGDRN